MVWLFIDKDIDRFVYLVEQLFEVFL